jgi:RNA polymerase sigma-54 factor
MALEFKQTLRQIQAPTITLQLQQAIKLLQLNQLEMAEMVQKELVENPVLEVADDGEGEPTDGAAERASRNEEPAEKQLSDPPKADEVPSTNDVDDMDWAAYLAERSERSRIHGAGEARAEDLPTYDQVLTRPDTLSEHLVWQLAMVDLDQVERIAAEQIIGNLDDDGYLTLDLVELADEHLPLGVLERVLPIIRQFDPVGVGARDLRECLLAQAYALYPEDKDLALLLDQHMKALERRDPAIFARAAGISLERARNAMRHVIQLDPRPGRAFNNVEARYITPDVFVWKVGEEWEVQLNDDGLPRLRVSNYYRSVLQGMESKDRDYVRERLRSATWLIRSIYQRRQTIYKVVRSILKQQLGFFEHGVARLRPMVLRDVADDIAMHESTVSRVTSNKYVHCSQGTFPLKFFFNSGVRTQSGDDLASEAVKEKLRHYLQQEDPRSPLSDQELVRRLEQDGIEVARRTVAKYRSSMGFLPSSKRRRMY